MFVVEKRSKLDVEDERSRAKSAMIRNKPYTAKNISKKQFSF